MSDTEFDAAENAGLMLRIRAEALEANLTKVQGFPAKAPNRRQAIVVLNANLRKLLKLVNDIDTEVYRTKGDTAGESQYIPSSAAELRERVTGLQEKFSQIHKRMTDLLDNTRKATKDLENTIGTIDDMIQGCFEFPPGEKFSQLLSQDLTGRTKPPLDVVKNVLNHLDQPNPELWRDYHDNASVPSQAIFAEYADFLGGLALRDIGFDEGISRVAEHLIKTYKTNRETAYPWLVALPAAREQAVAKTLARTVRVCFPQWTVWALPFLANAFWHVIAREDFDFDKELSEQLATKLPGTPVIPERFQTCLADAFATCMMGPAYAYAAFYLVLNPLFAYAGDPASPAPKSRRQRPGAALPPVGDDTRSFAIQTMLILMDRKASAIAPPYAKITNNLQKMWLSAIEQAGGAVETETSKNDKKTVFVMVEALWNVLEKCDCCFAVLNWEHTETLDQVLNEHSLAEDELPGVLNAIWKALVEPGSKVSMDDVEDKLRKRILAKKESGKGVAQAPNLPSKVTR